MEIIKTESRLYFLPPKDQMKILKINLKAVILPAVILLFVQEFGCESQFLLKIEIFTDVDVLEMLIVETFT